MPQDFKVVDTLHFARNDLMVVLNELECLLQVIDCLFEFLDLFGRLIAPFSFHAVFNFLKTVVDTASTEFLYFFHPADFIYSQFECSQIFRQHIYNWK